MKRQRAVLFFVVLELSCCFYGFVEIRISLGSDEKYCLTGGLLVTEIIEEIRNT